MEILGPVIYTTESGYLWALPTRTVLYARVIKTTFDPFYPSICFYKLRVENTGSASGMMFEFLLFSMKAFTCSVIIFQWDKVLTLDCGTLCNGSIHLFDQIDYLWKQKQRYTEISS